MRPILLLHGALGSSSQLDPLKKALEAGPTGASVFILNFSGHSGEPFGKEFGIQTFAEDVLKFLDARRLGQVDIFGYSMGGYVALWLAHEHPNRIEKIITLGTKFDWSAASAEKEVRKLDPEKIQEKVPAFARILEHRHSPNDWKELLNKTSAMMLGLGSSPLLTEDIVKSIQHPTLICLGDRDDMADRSYSEKVARQLPHGKFLLLKDTPHPIEKIDVKSLQEIVASHFG
ncbi:MAG: alpha/beta fold hydrolase [Bacteroidota bacterium]